MIDLEKLFAEKVLFNIENARVKKGLDAVEIVNKLIEMGVFSKNGSAITAEEIAELKKNKRNLYNDWRSGKSRSYMRLVDEIAKILDTTLEDLSNMTIARNNGNVLNNSINESNNAVLLIAKDSEFNLSKQEWELIQFYRSLKLKKQAKLVRFIVEMQEESHND